MENAKFHTATAISTVMLELRAKRTPQPPSSPDVCPSDFLLFGWLKGKLQQRQLTDAHQLFGTVDEILTSLSVDTIEEVFRNWIHRPERLIEVNGHDVR
jgi:hypothetical protein